MQAASGIENEHGQRLLARPFEAALGDVYRLIARWLGIDGNIELLANLLQLLHGGGPLHIGGDDARLLAVLAEPVGQLARLGGLTGALQTDEHEDGGRRSGELNLAAAILLAAEHGDQFLVDEAKDLLRRCDATQHLGADGRHGAFLHARDELFDQLEIDIGLEQRLAHLAHGLGHVLLGDPALATQALEDTFEPLRETFKHLAVTSHFWRGIVHPLAPKASGQYL